MFEIWESCGYTPEVLGHLTMAELLAGASVVFLPLAALGLIRAWHRAG
jgi:disulfide bond formation protein DsbB